MITKIPHIALAGILGLGLALSAALPASADKPKGRLKDEKRTLKQANKQLNRADNRFERQAARANVFSARQNLQRERFQIKRDDRNRRVFNSGNRRPFTSYRRPGNRFGTYNRTLGVPGGYRPRFRR